MENNLEQHLEEIEKFLTSVINTVSTRAEKYSTDENPFRNFEHAAGVFSGLDPVIVIKSMLGIKLARLDLWMNNRKEFSDDSAEDTFIDIVGYISILRNYMLCKDKILIQENKPNQSAISLQDLPEDFKLALANRATNRTTDDPNAKMFVGDLDQVEAAPKSKVTEVLDKIKSFRKK